VAIPTNSPDSPRRTRRRLGMALADRAAREAIDHGNPGDPVVAVSEVTVRDFRFAPDAIEVPVGTTVTWRWEGDHDHNVVGDGFESPVQDEGTFTHTFAEPGTSDYRCTVHPFMRGKVVVTRTED
jgi:plastocyanin